LIQDKHSHDHGSICLKDLVIGQPMYEYGRIRYLATVLRDDGRLPLRRRTAGDPSTT
jgi:hypothetical protein